MASRGINCEKRKQKGADLQGCSVLPLLTELTPILIFQASPLLFSQGQMLPLGKSIYAQKPEEHLCAFLLCMWPTPGSVPVMHSVT